MAPSNIAYQAYTTAHQTLPKTRQVVMLYDGVIRFLKQAKLAIEEGRIEDRYTLLQRTSEVIMGLQGSLDFEANDAMARTLYDYYSAIDGRILRLQRSNDPTECDRLIQDIKSMRDAWAKIDGSETAGDNVTSDAAIQAMQSVAVSV